MNREAVYAALFAKLAGVPGFETTSRALLHWSAIEPKRQPALFMTVGRQVPVRARGVPLVWECEAPLYVYAHEKNSREGAEILLLQLIDRVRGALAKDPITGFEQTLGGLVQRAWIDGAIETFEGTLGEQAAALVPVKMLVA